MNTNHTRSLLIALVLLAVPAAAVMAGVAVSNNADNAVKFVVDNAYAVTFWTRYVADAVVWAGLVLAIAASGHLGWRIGELSVDLEMNLRRRR